MKDKGKLSPPNYILMSAVSLQNKNKLDPTYQCQN